MFMVDLAVPRDVEPEAGELDDVFLYTVDDLGQIVAGNRDARARRGGAGRGDHREPGRPVHALDAGARERAADPRAARAGRAGAPPRARARAALPARGDDPAAVLEALSHGLTNKLLHAPTQALHDTGGEEGRALADTASRLYRIK